MQLKDMIEKGELGELYYLEGDYQYGRLEKITEGWRGQLDFYSVMLGGGVHMVDLLCWLVNSRVKEVTAYGNNICSKDSDFKFNDFTVGLMKFENDVVAKIAANFGCMAAHFHQLTVFGTKATFINDKDKARLVRSRDPEVAPTYLDSAYPGVEKGVLLQSFIETVCGNEVASINLSELFDMMSVCFALEKSSREGQPITVSYL